MIVIKRLVIALLILVGTLAVLALYHPDLRPKAPPSGQGTGTVAIGGPFALVDGNGNAFTDADLKGGYSLVFFGFTHCPDICPLTLQTVGAALDLAGPAGEKVTPVFITVDPERDTAEAVGAYASAFHPRFVALTGTAEQLQTAMQSYKVFARKVPLKDAEGNDTGTYTMEHSGLIFFMDPEGGYVSHFSSDTTAEDMAAYIRRTVNP